MTFIDIPEALRPKNPPKTESKPSQPSEPPKPSENTSGKTDESQWGYDLYPERRRGASRSLTDVLTMTKGREELRKMDCERGVYRCIKESPLVRLMLGALKSSGCAIDIRRHISCEKCAPNVSGGFDPILNQVVICHNNTFKESAIQGVLTHELIHMFDYCRNNLDFKNLDHLACTEIRAANLVHCSFVSAWLNGDTSIFKFRDTHQYCVRNKALSSMLAVRDVTREQAMEAIERVFSKCYNDLEPLGRRLRRNSLDMHRAFQDGYYYGYED
ncbi:unnamed protein product [Ceutorhynchus assimilis]|uniref:Mitochondrial inner membrane protease ATP23 n=1 Tax=Ceutorhynchus assimilis TaxID=467358 RepID=A0A9N9MTE2_9CUCU|nr:unnamed protein product [Ceutorhynchus assimilis]